MAKKEKPKPKPKPRASTIEIEQIVDAPFSLVQEHANVDPIGGARVPLRHLGFPFPGELSHPVDVRFVSQPDSTDRGRAHDEIAFTWAANAGWLPDFRGVLRFRIFSGRTLTTLDGSYVPPFGPFGSVFDLLIGHRIARATMTEMLARLSRDLETRWSSERAAFASPS